MAKERREAGCPERPEDGPHVWVEGAPGCPDWCWFCEIERPEVQEQGATAADQSEAASDAQEKEVPPACGACGPCGVEGPCEVCTAAQGTESRQRPQKRTDS